MRIGLGYDVHVFEKERDLVIGGVKIPYEYGLKGHSDADVLIHALMDAILGALGRGDIGEHFPDNDPNYKGADSMLLLDQVVSIMHSDGYKLLNADCLVIAERPKLSPYKNEMKERIALGLKSSPSRVNVKATTTEGLGFTGRREGIAAEAVVLLESIDR